MINAIIQIYIRFFLHIIYLKVDERVRESFGKSFIYNKVNTKSVQPRRRFHLARYPINGLSVVSHFNPKTGIDGTGLTSGVIYLSEIAFIVNIHKFRRNLLFKTNTALVSIRSGKQLFSILVDCGECKGTSQEQTNSFTFNVAVN